MLPQLREEAPRMDTKPPGQQSHSCLAAAGSGCLNGCFGGLVLGEYILAPLLQACAKQADGFSNALALVAHMVEPQAAGLIWGIVQEKKFMLRNIVKVRSHPLQCIGYEDVPDVPDVLDIPDVRRCQ